MELTAGEKRVLYGLVRFPGLNDVQLAEKIGISRVTVTSSRNKFQKAQLIHTSMVPDFERAGFEILTTLYGQFTPPAGSGLKGISETLKQELSSMFYMLRSGGQHLSLGVAESLTHFREHLVRHHRAHHDSGYLTDKRHNYVLFPLKHTTIHRFFDFSGLLADHFGMDELPVKVVTVRNKVAWKPTKGERRTFDAMMRNPSGTDSDVAKDAKVTRQTVNQFRKKFLDEGLIKPLKVPNMSKLGYKITAFTHLHLDPNVKKEDRESALKEILTDTSHVLKVTGDLEAVVISIHKNKESFGIAQKRMLDIYDRNKLLIEAPEVHIYPDHQTDVILNHSYGQISGG